MSNIKLPLDQNGLAIPAVELIDGGAHHVNIAVAATKNATPFMAADGKYGARIISLYATQDCFIKMGDNAVVATAADHFFPAGIYYDFSIKRNVEYISVLRSTADGVLHISEKS